MDYEPAESSTGLFGGNSNWRGPIWFPVNYLLIESLQKFHHYLGRRLQSGMPDRLGPDNDAVGSGGGDLAPADADLPARRRRAGGRCMGRRALPDTIRTGAIWCCSTNISTATTGGRGRQPSDRLDGRWWRSCCSRAENENAAMKTITHRTGRSCRSRLPDQALEPGMAGDQRAGRVRLVHDYRA